MAFHSNMHMIIGTQQMVAMTCKDEEKIENLSGTRKESKTNTKKTGKTPNLFVNMIRKQFGEKKSSRHAS